MMSFFRFENRWEITATLRMTTALSVGSRASLMPAGSDLPVIKTPEGVPFIPGSSLKGVVRAYTERLLRTMDGLRCQINGQRLWACDPLDEQKRCVTGERKKQLVKRLVEQAQDDEALDDEALTRNLWEESCTACRLFGSPWIASRVSFQDARLVNREDLLRLVEVRDGVGIDRDLGAARTGIKYDFETVPAGARFGIRIIVENAEEWEVGLLLTALQAMREGLLPIGGKTTRGPGWGTLEEIEVQRLTKEKLLDYLAGQPMETVSAADLLKAFRPSVPQGGE
mgnify:CR=1 FL=1